MMLSGSEAVALASVGATVLVAAISGLVQVRLEVMRRRAERENKMDERWLDHRRELYAEFLEGADGCVQHNRERGLYIYSLENGQFGEFPPGEEPTFSSSADVTAGIGKCAAALSKMRLFAPEAVTSAALEFIEITRFIEHFGDLDVVRAQIAVRELNEGGGDFPTADQHAEVAQRAEIAKRLIAAMREDLGADSAQNVNLGDLAQPIPFS